MKLRIIQGSLTDGLAAEFFAKRLQARRALSKFVESNFPGPVKYRMLGDKIEVQAEGAVTPKGWRRRGAVFSLHGKSPSRDAFKALPRCPGLFDLGLQLFAEPFVNGAWALTSLERLGEGWVMSVHDDADISRIAGDVERLKESDYWLAKEAGK